MSPRNHSLIPPDDRDPLRVMFVITSMPVGGMETLLVNLIRRLDRSRFAPQLCCLKHFDKLGRELAAEIPAFERLLAGKYDLRVLPRLTALMRSRRIDAVVTVGTGGDKMFWGRLAAKAAGVPVIVSALHSTGLPDCVERLNRLLAPWTDGFIAVAPSHARYLAEYEGCPAHKVRVVPNGVDLERFCPMDPDPQLRASLGLAPDAPVAGIVAALRPEKNHELFLEAAARVHRALPTAQFVIVGDGPRREELQALSQRLGLSGSLHFLGTRNDVPQLLASLDVLVLSSHMEASPVSLLEGLACGKPVVATDVGSISETVRDGTDGFLVPPGDAVELAAKVTSLLSNPDLARRMGQAGREHVVRECSVERMVAGYEDLLTDIYESKCTLRRRVLRDPSASEASPTPVSR